MEVTFNRRTIISFPNNDDLPDIESGIEDGSLSIDEVLYSDRLTIGTYSANRFECDVYDYPTVGAEKIYVYQIVDEVEGEEPIEVPLFTGVVDSCVTNRGRFEDSKHIVAYDVLYSTGKLDVSAWWEQVFDTETSVTVKTLRESLLTFAGLTYDVVDLPNDTVTITQTQQLNTISFESMFKYILEINATNANVTRDGRVQFLTVSSEEPIDVAEVYAQNTSEFDTYTIPAYGAVRITLSSRSVVATVGESNFLDITDNLLLLDKTVGVLTPIAQAILNVINTFTYKPASIDMIWNQLDIKVGDKLLIGGNVYLVCENYMNGSMLVEQQISSNGGEKIEDTTPSYDASKADMQAQIEASSLKYYRHYNKQAIEIESITRPIITIRYTSSEDGVVVFHGCVIIDVERIDDTKEAQTILQYSVNSEIVREYTPTETYHHDGRHTLNLLHFWEAGSGKADRFVVYLTAVNCKVTIGAYRIEAYMEGMGLVGEAVWDGFIDIADEINVIPFENEPKPIDFEDELTPTIDTAIVLEADDNIYTVAFENEPKPLDFEADLYLNKERLKGNTWLDVKTIGDWATIKNDYGW